MAKITLPALVAQYLSAASFNTKFTDIEDHLNNKVLYRNNPSGEPNEMGNDLDMDSNSILNLPTPYELTEPVRLQDVQDALDSVIGVLPVSQAPQVATEGQTDFTCASTWLVRAEIHWVRVDGCPQVPDVDFTVDALAPGVITFTTPLSLGMVVDVTSFAPNVAYPSP